MGTKNIYLADIYEEELDDGGIGNIPLDEAKVDKLVQKLGKYEDLEDKLNGISIDQVVNEFIKIIEGQIREGYEHVRF